MQFLLRRMAQGFSLMIPTSPLTNTMPFTLNRFRPGIFPEERKKNGCDLQYRRHVTRHLIRPKRCLQCDIACDCRCCDEMAKLARQVLPKATSDVF